MHPSVLKEFIPETAEFLTIVCNLLKKKQQQQKTALVPED